MYYNPGVFNYVDDAEKVRELLPMNYTELVRDACESGEEIRAEHMYKDIYIGYIIYPVSKKAAHLFGRVITETKNPEKALQESEERYRTIVDTARDVIFTLSTDGTITSLNPAFKTITGWSRAEWVGKFVGPLIHPEDSSFAMETFQRLLQGETPSIYELRVLSKSGGYVIWEFTTSPQVLDGKVVGVLGIARDITERKRAEEALRRHARELERSNQLKDLFTDIMRHDLLSPAGIILDYAELLLEEVKDAEAKQDIEAIKRNVEKLIAMIVSASKLAKLASEKELKLERMDLGAVMQEGILNFGPLIRKKEMQLEYEQKEAPAMVNPVIEEVFSNLLSNAIKYSPAKSKIIVCIEEEYNSWKIMVKDHGEGIPDEEKKRIFERFTRRGKGGVKGTGLGLAIAKRIVELHRGKVWVEDNTVKYLDDTGRTQEKKQGSIFYVELPKTMK